MEGDGDAIRPWATPLWDRLYARLVHSNRGAPTRTGAMSRSDCLAEFGLRPRGGQPKTCRSARASGPARSRTGPHRRTNGGVSAGGRAGLRPAAGRRARRPAPGSARRAGAHPPHRSRRAPPLIRPSFARPPSPRERGEGAARRDVGTRPATSTIGGASMKTSLLPVEGEKVPEGRMRGGSFPGIPTISQALWFRIFVGRSSHTRHPETNGWRAARETRLRRSATIV